MSIKLIKTRRGCEIAEKEDRYDVMFNDILFDQLYYNMRGYVGCLPSPNENGQPTRLNIGERGITAYKQEVSKLNKEWKTIQEKKANESKSD